MEKKSQVSNKIVLDTAPLPNLDEVFAFLYGLREQVISNCKRVEEVLEKAGFDKELQQFLGAVHGFLDDLDLFLKTVSIVEGKVKGEMISEERGVKPTPGEEKQIMARLAQLDKEYQELEKEKDLTADFTKLELLDRKDTVGSTYDPEFLVEEILRGVGYIGGLSKIFNTVQEAYDVIVGRDPNISETQKEKIKELLKKHGYTVK